MKTKVCEKCWIEKSIEEFELRTDTGKYRNTCKLCRKKYLEEYAKTNEKRLKEYRKKWYLDNHENKLKYQREYSKTNAEVLKEKNKLYREKNKERIHAYKLEYYKNNKEFVSEQSKIYYEQNSEKIKDRTKKYAKDNKEKINLYVREKKQNDKVFKLKHQIRNMLWESFNRKYIKKRFKGENIVGCSIDKFISYLLKTYEKNYGEKWDGKELVHIDHIVPLSTANTETEVIKLCHYTNLQLLKGKDNLSKGYKLDWSIVNNNE